jgi:tetratricopeptide (TPR) repeat protein
VEQKLVEMLSDPGAQIPHGKGIEEQSVGNRHLAIQSVLERHPLVVVWGPSGRGKTWEVARLARSQALSRETSVDRPDIYYETGLLQLLERIGQEHPSYQEALVYQQRLHDNFALSRLYGDTETLRAERSKIVDGLNRLALSTLGISFNELCNQGAPKTGTLWLSLDKRDSLQSILASDGKLADHLEALQISFEVSPQTSIKDQGTCLLSTLQKNHLLVCFDNYHEVEQRYRAEFEHLFSRMQNRFQGSGTRVVIIGRHPISTLHSIELGELSTDDIAMWIKTHAEAANHDWVTDNSKVDELAIEWKNACKGNYFAMTFLARQRLARGDCYAQLKERAMKDAHEALRRAAWEALSTSEVSRIVWGVQILQDMLGFIDECALLELVSPENRGYVMEAMDGLSTQGFLEPVYTLREEVRMPYSPERDEDRADLRRMAAYFEQRNQYAEACTLYLKAGCFDQAVALISEHSLELRRRGQAARIYELIKNVDADRLEDWLNAIRLWVIRADFLGWMDRLDDAEGVAEYGLDLIGSKCEEDRARCRLEEVKLWIRRGIPSARRGQFEQAHGYFKKAEPLLCDYQGAIQAEREPGEAKRLAAVEQELILKNNLGLIYLNLALQHPDGEEAQENARKAKETFVSGHRKARVQTHTRRYGSYFSHLAAQFQLHLARYYEQWEGNTTEAISKYEEALSALQRIGANAGAVDCANSLAVCLAGIREFKRALEHAEESRRLAEELEDWEGVAMAYATMSYDVYLAQAKRTQNLSERDRLRIDADRTFCLSTETWNEHEGETESADLRDAWQAIRVALKELQGTDPEGGTVPSDERV